VSGIAAQEMNRRRDMADKLNLTRDIEKLSAAGKTAEQIVMELKKNKRLQFIQDEIDLNKGNRSGVGTFRSEGINFVRAVRDTLGIPSQDQRSEYAAWLSGYKAREAKTPAVQPAPVVPQPLKEPKPEVQDAAVLSQQQTQAQPETPQEDRQNLMALSLQNVQANCLMKVCWAGLCRNQ